MIAVDSNILIASLKGLDGPGVRLMRKALDDSTLVIPPPVVTEVLSFPVDARVATAVRDYRRLPIEPGFWDRAAETRRAIICKGLRARMPDVLIAQCCVDAGAALITADSDFRHFIPLGLRLAV